MKNKGIYNKGVIKRTPNQVKKHVTQMSKEEIVFLEKAVHSIVSKVHFSQHFKTNRVACSESYIKELLSKDLSEMIIEYNETPSKNKVDKRVLIRDKDLQEVLFLSETTEEFTETANLCIVVSILTGSVITAYWNLSSDNHKTMDWRRYNSKLEIIK